MNDMQERPLQVYRERGETNPLAAMLLFFVGLVLLIVFAAALIVSWHEFVREAPAILIVLLIVAGLVLCGVLIVAGIYKGYLAWLRVQHAREELASMKDERRRAQDRHDVQKHLALTRLHADERGNRPVIYDPYSGQVITLPSGNFVQNVSSHYAPHITYPGETRVTEEKNAPDQLPSPARIPTFSEQLQRRITAPHEPQSILGYTDGGPRLGQWDKLHSFFVCGGSGSGKSSTVSYYAALAVLHGARLLVIDPDAEEDDSITQRLAGLEFAFYAPVARDPQSAARIIALAERELESPGDYPLVWIVDEFTSIMRAGEMSDKGWGAIADRLAIALENYAQRGRKRRRTVIVIGQISKASRTGGTELRASMTATFVHRLHAQQARMLLDNSEAKLCPTLSVGEVMVLFNNATETYRMTIPYATPGDMREVASLMTPVSGSRFSSVSGRETPAPFQVIRNPETLLETEDETAWQAKVSRVRELRSQGQNQRDIIWEVWGVTAGGSTEYARRQKNTSQLSRCSIESR